MKYIKKLFKLLVEDTVLAVGILLSIVLTKLSLVVGLNPTAAGILFTLLMIFALGTSLLSRSRKVS